MWKIIVCLCMVVVVARSQFMEYECLHFNGLLPSDLYVEGCSSPPCSVPQRQDLVVHTYFRAPRVIRNMTTHATALFFTIPIVYPLREEAVTCNSLANTVCPLLRGEMVKYTLRLRIAPFIPVGVSVPVEFRVLDDNDALLICFRVLINVTAPVSSVEGRNSTLLVKNEDYYKG